MKRRFWRFSRPVGSLVCVLLLLVLTWFMRFAAGTPHGSPEAVLRRTERRYLRLPGELVEVFETRLNAANAVTWRDGELAVYYLTSEDDDNRGEWKHRYQDGFLYRSAQPGSWGCCTTPFIQFDVNKGNMVTKRWFYVLVKNQDPQVTGGKLTVESWLGDYHRTWRAEADRTNPYYLTFRLEINGGGEKTLSIFNALCGGDSGDGATAEAEAVFIDADGNAVSSLRFDMIEELPDTERSAENGA